MKTVQISNYGSPDVLQVVDIPEPSLKANQILVENRAASVNPFDWKVRAGYLKDSPALVLPFTLGGDFSGKVIKVGEGVTGVKEGDEVFGTALILNGGSGSMAEVVAAGHDRVAPKPASLSFDQAAAFPLVGSSAVQAITEHINLQSGQKILIHGGAGGIGHVAIQIAKALGGYVATTVSNDDIEFVKSLGADEVIDYKQQQFEQVLKDFDAVFDTVGGETTDKSFAVLKKGGILVSMAGQPSEELAKQHEVTAIGQNTKTNTQHLTKLAEFINHGKVTINIDKTFSLDQIKEAFIYQEEVHPKGKIILHIKD